MINGFSNGVIPEDDDNLGWTKLVTDVCTLLNLVSLLFNCGCALMAFFTRHNYDMKKWWFLDVHRPRLFLDDAEGRAMVWNVAILFNFLFISGTKRPEMKTCGRSHSRIQAPSHRLSN